MASTLKSTTNYDLFEIYEINREVNEETKDFQNLVDSMREHGFIPAYPLHCVPNGYGKLQIKGGHHRFRAAQKLGIAVKYVVCADDADVHDLEKAGPRKWSTNDFVISFCKKGLQDYVEVKDFSDKTGISLGNSLSMFNNETAGSKNIYRRDSFFKGGFKIKNREHPYTVGDIVKHLHNIGIVWAHQDNFVRALSKLMLVHEFDPKRFKDKATTHKYLLEKQKNLQNYLMMIEEVYNYKSTKAKKVNLAFKAQEASNARKNTLLGKRT